MGVTWSEPRRGNPAAQMGGRFWLTAKAARALGHRVPSRIHDDEPLRLIPKETPK